jgi:hypothetical protein
VLTYISFQIITKEKEGAAIILEEILAIKNLVLLHFKKYQKKQEPI